MGPPETSNLIGCENLTFEPQFSSARWRKEKAPRLSAKEMKREGRTAAVLTIMASIRLRLRRGKYIEEEDD